MSNALVSLTQKLAATLNMGDGAGLIETLKATAFKGQVSDAQMTALMVVANQYALNPWTKEIYAFPDKNNGIVPSTRTRSSMALSLSKTSSPAPASSSARTATAPSRSLSGWLNASVARALGSPTPSACCATKQ